MTFALLWLFVGCDSNRSNGELYLERLANALELTADTPSVSQLMVFPAASSLAIQRPDTKINLLEFLQVNRCNLGALVGARNSGLGRVQTASQRWLYDTQLVAGLMVCNDTTQELRALAAARQADLGVAAFNAIFSGSEWHAFATPALTAGASVPDNAGLERALLALNSLVLDSQRGDIDSAAMAQLEDHLATLRFSAALGEQRRAWLQQSATLEHATRMLLSALATNPACRTGKPTVQGKIRQNVFQQFYIAGVQPELALQGQPDRGWVKALSTLVTNAVAGTVTDEPLSRQAAQVKSWHQQVMGEQARHEYGRWKAAITAHSRAWQRQLGICGLMPGV